MPDEQVGLHSIAAPRSARKPRKRVGRGEGSGYGKTAGRGTKGARARSGTKRKAGYEGGQNPLHMRMRKLRGPHMKKSMPFEPFRTQTQAINFADLNRFEDNAEVTLGTLREHGMAKRKGVPVKVLAKGELERKGLKVSAHAFSASARERIEAAGGSCTIVEPKTGAAQQ